MGHTLSSYLHIKNLPSWAQEAAHMHARTLLHTHSRRRVAETTQQMDLRRAAQARRCCYCNGYARRSIVGWIEEGGGGCGGGCGSGRGCQYVVQGQKGPLKTVNVPRHEVTPVHAVERVQTSFCMPHNGAVPTTGHQQACSSTLPRSPRRSLERMLSRQEAQRRRVAPTHRSAHRTPSPRTRR